MKKYIKGGAGAGYSITAEVHLNKIVEISSVSLYDDGWGTIAIEFEGEFRGTADNIVAKSYYHTSSWNDEVDCVCYGGRLYEDYFTLDDYDNYKDLLVDDDDNFNEELAIQFIKNSFANGGIGLDTETMYGGGYSHCTWDGELQDDDEYCIYVTNQEVINYIDRGVSGNNSYTTYDVLDSNGDSVTDEPFEDYDDAVDYAKENGYIEIRTDYWEEDYLGDVDLTYSDTKYIGLE